MEPRRHKVSRIFFSILYHCIIGGSLFSSTAPRLTFQIWKLALCLRETWSFTRSIREKLHSLYILSGNVRSWFIVLLHLARWHSTYWAATTCLRRALGTVSSALIYERPAPRSCASLKKEDGSVVNSDMLLLHLQKCCCWRWFFPFHSKEERLIKHACRKIFPCFWLSWFASAMKHYFLETRNLPQQGWWYNKWLKRLFITKAVLNASFSDVYYQWFGPEFSFAGPETVS